MSKLAELLEGVNGWLTIDEAELLATLANKVPDGGTIVEIGSYHGRSTIALLYGAKANTTVYAIDPHHTHEAGGFQFGSFDMPRFISNIAPLPSDMLRKLKIINLMSINAYVGTPYMDIDLLWIDGAHDYEDVNKDFILWGSTVTDKGVIAVHDSTGGWPDPTRVVQEALKSKLWKRDRIVGYTSVLRRKKAKL